MYKIKTQKKDTFNCAVWEDTKPMFKSDVMYTCQDCKSKIITNHFVARCPVCNSYLLELGLWNGDGK